MKITLLQPFTAGKEGPDFYHVQVYGLAKNLARIGHDVTVLTASFGPDAKRSAEQRDGYDIIRLPAKGPFFQQLFITNLAGELERTEPDILQAPELIELPTYQASRWAARNRVPFVIWQGNYRFSGKLVAGQKIFVHTLGRAAAERAGRMIAKNTCAAQYLRGFGISNGKVVTIPVGIDIGAFLSGNDEIPDGIPESPFILSVGQLVKRKNHACIIRALADLPARMRLLIIGRGPEEDDLRACAAQHGVHDRVTIRTEAVPNVQMKNIYKNAFATVMPSRYEIFGMTLLESLACGTPVIARREGGMADIVEDGASGALYEGPDECEIASHVKRIMDDQSYYENLRSGALSRSADFDWSIIAPRFSACYEALCKGEVG